MKPFAQIRQQALANIAERKRMESLAYSLGTEPTDWQGYRSLTEMADFVEQHTAAGYDTFVKPFGSRAALLERLATARKAL